jgi:RNA polymerase sigma-70 factor (ECF subfamily)
MCCCTERITELARGHARWLAGIARAEGIGPGDVLDIVQDAFITLLGRRDAEALCARPADTARVLAAIVRNAARNARRRHHRARVHVEVDEAMLAIEPQPVDDGRVAQLATCMNALGETPRQVVTLRVLEELSGEDTARTLGLTPGHVAVLLHRARKDLERCMAVTG